MKKRISLSMIIILGVLMGLAGNNLPASANQSQSPLTKPFMKGKLADGSLAYIRGSPVAIAVRDNRVKVVFKEKDHKIFVDPLAVRNAYFGEGPQEKIIRLIIKYRLEPESGVIQKILDKKLYQWLTFAVAGKIFRSFIVDVFSDGSFLVEIPNGFPPAVGQKNATVSPSYLRIFPQAFVGESAIDQKWGGGKLPPGILPRVLENIGYSLPIDYLRGKDLQSTIKNIFNEFSGSTQKSWYLIEFVAGLLRQQGVELDGARQYLTMFDNGLSHVESRDELLYASFFWDGKKMGAGYLSPYLLKWLQERGLDVQITDQPLDSDKKPEITYLAAYSPAEDKSRIVGIQGNNIIKIPFETKGFIFSIIPLRDGTRLLVSPERYPIQNGQPQRFLEINLADDFKPSHVDGPPLLAIYPRRIDANMIIYIQYGFEKEGGGLYLLDLDNPHPRLIVPADHALSFDFLKVFEEDESISLLLATKQNKIYKISFRISDEGEPILLENKMLGLVSGWNPYIIFKDSPLDANQPARVVVETSWNWEKEAGTVEQIFIIEAAR